MHLFRLTDWLIDWLIDSNNNVSNTVCWLCDRQVPDASGGPVRSRCARGRSWRSGPGIDSLPHTTPGPDSPAPGGLPFPPGVLRRFFFLIAHFFLFRCVAAAFDLPGACRLIPFLPRQLNPCRKAVVLSVHSCSDDSSQYQACGMFTILRPLSCIVFRRHRSSWELSLSLIA